MLDTKRLPRQISPFPIADKRWFSSKIDITFYRLSVSLGSIAPYCLACPLLPDAPLLSASARHFFCPGECSEVSQ